MGRFLLFVLIFFTASTIFYMPWMAGVAYVINSLLQPQYLWPWVFQGMPIFKVVAALSIIAFFITLAQNKLSLGIYKEKQNAVILIIWTWMHISNILSPYKGEYVSVPPEVVLGTFNSIVIMYFILLPLLSDDRSLRWLCYSFIFVGAYYTYWANSAYIHQEWYRFSNNRLTGPYASPYADGNALSTLIVMCLPFIILYFFKSKNIVTKLAVLLCVPLAWHAIILFSSRAALLASIVTLLFIALAVKSKRFNVLIFTGFLAFMVYQGSLLVTRTSDTIEAAKIDANEPINPRLISWEVGLRLIPEYPVFGAGVQMFEAASRNHFPGMTPHVAHNTFLNFSANTGLLTGLMFLSLLFMAWKRLKNAKKFQTSFADFDYYATIASCISLLGFFVCSMFLDLIIYEPFYVVLMINLISWHSLSKRFSNIERKNA